MMFALGMGWTRRGQSPSSLGAHATQCDSDAQLQATAAAARPLYSFLTFRWVEVEELRTMWPLASRARWQ